MQRGFCSNVLVLEYTFLSAVGVVGVVDVVEAVEQP